MARAVICIIPKTTWLIRPCLLIEHAQGPHGRMAARQQYGKLHAARRAIEDACAACSRSHAGDIRCCSGSGRDWRTVQGMTLSEHATSAQLLGSQTRSTKIWGQVDMYDQEMVKKWSGERSCISHSDNGTYISICPYPCPHRSTNAGRRRFYKC